MSAPSSDREAIRQTIAALVEAGATLLYVDDGEELITPESDSEALDAIMAVDEAYLGVTLANTFTSWVRFVLGNDPAEVICDYGVSLSAVLDPLTEGWWA